MTTVDGSPYEMTVYPGIIDPGRCYTDVPTPIIPEQEAGVAFNFNIQFVDLYGNQHYQALEDELIGGMIVEVDAIYLDHDDWPSPIGVPDDPTWMATYGTTVPASTISDNGDGTIVVALKIRRAGDYSIEIKVDTVQIADSPLTALLEVAPSISINGANCVAVEVQEATNAGFTYQFMI